MQAIINHLIQLQELNLVRDEQKFRGNSTYLDQLDASIVAMTDNLPADVLATYQRLKAKDKVVLSPVDDDACAVCRMRMPISLLQAVRMVKAIQQCPNCARMLYQPAEPIKRTSKTPRRTAPRKVGISRFSAPGLMLADLKAETKEAAIVELATCMEREGFVDSAEALVNAALRREAIVGTGFEHGLAFPHTRGAEGGGLALAMGISRKGIAWDSDSKQLTRLVFFLAIPTAASAFYLKLLAGLAETFSKADNRKAIMDEKSPEALWKTLCKVTRAYVK